MLEKEDWSSMVMCLVVAMNMDTVLFGDAISIEKSGETFFLSLFYRFSVVLGSPSINFFWKRNELFLMKY